MSEVIPSGNAQTFEQGRRKTVIKSLALGGVLGGGAPCAVDLKDGRILRIRPLHYDWKYRKENLNPWEFERNGKTLDASMKSMPSPFSLAYKKRVYSPNRIKYPLKRIDWDPNGERNPQNRGKSKYQRISWDEATDLISSEIRRVHQKYGPLGILLQADGHGECKTINTPHGQPSLLLDKLGGFTQQVRNPDSWEGWYWGAKHVWGNGFIGMMQPFDNIVKDMTEHCDMVLFWGCDPETTPWGFTGQSATRICYFWTEVGIKQVYICPDLNYGAAVHADKWIPVYPNTDAALQLAIIYIWIIEKTYDKEYMDTHTVGFDRLKSYVLGEEDGVPKTPAWASEKCGVPARIIKALAREYAAKTTSIAHYFGGSMIRGPYSHEPARLEIVLLAMQGLGKPGVHQAQLSYTGMPRAEGLKSTMFYNPLLTGQRLSRPHAIISSTREKQLIPKTLIQEAILNPPLTFTGSGGISADVNDQFQKYTYPIPKEEGGTEIHMIWTDTPCRTTCWNYGNRTIEAFRDKKIECVVAQHPWLENDCFLADIILPSNTTLEVEDIVTNTRQGVQFHTVTLQEQAIHPIGESMSDFEVVAELARKMDLYDEVTEGKTTEDLEKTVFEAMELSNYISWEEFKQNGYYVYPVAKGWKNDPAGLFKFYREPLANPLPTPTGKLEIFSESLASKFPNDDERPPYPKWIEKGMTHDERRSSERFKRYPLVMMSNHGRWRVHSQCDDISWTREAPTCKVKAWDGYWYEPCWINPVDAQARDITDNDIVKVYNERGIVLAGARVWERIRPGVVYMDHGARVDAILPGKVDRGGAINLIAPIGITSKNCVGQATSGYLVQVQKIAFKEMAKWRNEYPESFERKYNPASGLCFDNWIVK